MMIATLPIEQYPRQNARLIGGGAVNATGWRANPLSIQGGVPAAGLEGPEMMEAVSSFVRSSIN